MGDEEYLPADDREIRASLGLESAYGYHIETPDDAQLRDILLAVEAAGGGDAAEDAGAGRGGRGPSPYPCLRGARYSGCLGMDCPLQTCWTGGPTPRQAAVLEAQREDAEPPAPPARGAAVYLSDVLCHRCSHVVDVCEDDWRDGPAAGEVDGADRQTVGGQGRPRRMLTCGQGQWRHPISPRSFASRRIPIVDAVDPAHCPWFEDAESLHPDVIAYRRQQRQIMRDYRARLRRKGKE